MYSGKSSKWIRVVRIVIDIVNAVIGLAVLGLAVYTFIDLDSRMEMFPYIFYMGAGVNVVTGVKHFISEKRGSAFVAWIFAVVLILAGSWSNTVIKGF